MAIARHRFGHASAHHSRRVGNMIGASGGGMGNVVLAIRVKQGLRCLSGMNRPLDTQRLQRLGLQRTGDAVADRMLDVAATEIKAGNGGANELGIIGDIFKGIFDGASNGIHKASAGQPAVSPGEPVKSLGTALKELGISVGGPRDFANWWAHSKFGDLWSLQAEAKEAMRREFRNRGHNDHADAFRHAYWSFRMSQEKGPHVAKKVADGHERRPLDDSKEFSLTNSAQSPVELVMDLYNNHIERKLFLEHSGNPNLTPTEVAKIVRQALTSGRLQNQPFSVTGR